MKKLAIIIFVMLSFFGCSNLEFVYETNEQNKDLLNKTSYSIYGDSADFVHDSVLSMLGAPNNPLYSIIINSSREDSAVVISKDATASKFNIKYNISYDLKNLEKKCTIFKTTIFTESMYDSKSEGYSFGTDFSKKETSARALKKNINSFFSKLNNLSDLSRCSSEN